MLFERIGLIVDDLRIYVLHLTATALICAVIIRFLKGSSASKLMIKLLCGIVLTCSIIQPVKQFDFGCFREFTVEFRQKAEQAVMWGKDTASAAWAESISQGAEAYILEKAKAMKVDLAVEVELSDDEIPVPSAVLLTGHVAPYVKSVLSDTISQDLNIPKEKQLWISQ